MKVTVLQENLHKALSIVAKNISTKTQLPVLANVLLETKAGQLQFSSTNLETSITIQVGASIEVEGALTVPARFFQELVSSFPQDKVILSVDKANLRLECGKSEATLSGIAATEFPPLPQIGEKPDATIEKTLFGKGLPFVLISASTDESRPILTGIKFVEKNGEFMMVATDGFRLSLKKLPQNPGFGEGFVIPARVLGDVFRLASEDESEKVALYFSADKNQIIFALENIQISTRLIEGEYPTFEKIIPSAFINRVTFDRQELARAVKFASVYAKESANILKWQLKPEEIVIAANSPQLGENKTSVAATLEGEGGEIAFNARFLQDLLAVFPEDEVVFEMNGPLAPGVFKSKSDPAYLHIIMPVRVQS